MEDLVIGVLGGGQLGRMLVEAASRLNVQVAVLDSEKAPAKQINLVASDKHVTGSFAKAADVEALAAKSDVLTYEIEHVDTHILEKLSAQQQYLPGTNWKRMQPSWQTVRTIQDKFAQKEHLARFSIATARSVAVEDDNGCEAVKKIAEQLQYPLMLKSRTQAYDGRGNFPIKSAGEIEEGVKALAGRPLYVEQWAHFSLELAVMVIKTAQEATASKNEKDGWWKECTLAYPAVETVHEDSICKLVYAPGRKVARAKLQEAQDLARRAVATFEGTGVFGVEMFLLADGELVVNEIAPRPHNSGHYTIEACHMSQYEAQVRAVLPGLAPTIVPGATDMVVPAAVMLNILGGAGADSHLLVAQRALCIPGARVHLYGKGAGRPGRKMGHITVVGSSMSECERKIDPLIQLVDAVRAERNKPAAAVSAHSIQAAADCLAKKKPRPGPGPIVGVVMGSDSDLATLKPGLQFLQDMEIPFEVNITSAHRTPQIMLDYGKAAAGRGIKVIIAAAGGAAHLPGMMAAVTPLPVIGCPVKASSLDGLDSLLSIVQMPRGVPVATVSIGNSTNAALLAARIVGTSESRVQAWVERHLQQMEEENVAKAARLQADGWKAYQPKESWKK